MLTSTTLPKYLIVVRRDTPAGMVENALLLSFNLLARWRTGTQERGKGGCG